MHAFFATIALCKPISKMPAIGRPSISNYHVNCQHSSYGKLYLPNTVVIQGDKRITTMSAAFDGF